MTFELQYTDTKSNARAGLITTDHGQIQTPIFMPVGTLGTVKGVHLTELKEDIRAQIILGNTYHLYLRPGLEVIEKAGGLHRFNGFDRPMLTDSGGFQVFSLAGIRKLREEGAEFRSHIDGSKHIFTPEKVMDIERTIGADIMMAFDECPPGDSDYAYAKKSLGLTHRWLDRCIQRFNETEPKYGYNQSLFPIVQGCVYPDLRKQSAEFVASKGADGNAIGGLAVGEPVDKMYEMIEIVNEILPKDKPRYLMGVGTPVNILEGIERGVDMFDCVMPTRNGRNGMLFTKDGIINMRNKKWEMDFSPIEVDGASSVDTLYSKAYLQSNRFIKRLDWYIIKKFLGTYVFAIALIISIAVVFDFNEKMDKLMEHEAPWSKIIFEYYMNFIPYFSNLFSPLFVFIAVIFFTSKLAENSEIIAMFSTGMSFKRMMRPYMISAAIIALTTFMLSSYVIPKGSVTRLNFEDRYIKPKKQNTARNVQLEVDSGVIAYIDNYNNAMKTGNRFSLDKFVDKKLVSHLTARRITYDTATVHKWTIHDYMVRELDGLKEKITKGDKIDSIINMEPSDFLIMKNQQEMLTSPQLSDYIEKQKRRGFANIKEFEIEYHKRIAMSFASFILTIIGVSLSSRKTKGGMGLHLGIGLGLSFSYILFQTITSTFAINGNVPPVIAVWIPNILYAGIAFFLYQKAPK